jgi:hypothetical protein
MAGVEVSAMAGADEAMDGQGEAMGMAMDTKAATGAVSMTMAYETGLPIML